MGRDVQVKLGIEDKGRESLSESKAKKVKQRKKGPCERLGCKDSGITESVNYSGMCA